MHTQKIGAELFAAARGGFWVRADGYASAVGQEGHTDRLRRYGMQFYSDAWDKGWVRMSNPYGHRLLIEFTNDVSVDALQKTATLLRHPGGFPDHMTFEVWQDGPTMKGEGREGASRIASKLMQIAIKKNAEAKQDQLARDLAAVNPPLVLEARL